MNLTEFWTSLPAIGKVYWILAILSTTIFTVTILLSIIGHDADVDADVPHDAPFLEGLGGFVLSFKSILSFLMMFAWTGIFAMHLKISVITSLILSLVAGLIALFVVAGILYLLTKLTYSGTLNLDDAIGKTAKVYIKIPAKKKGIGKVQLILNDSLRTLDAMTEENSDITYNSEVVVIDVLENDVLLVKRKI